jgi:regulator of protease activity HflC (stomatin/prohibitin superfamily)
MGEILGVGGAGIFVVLIILVVILLRSFRIAQEYERAVIFALGRVTRRPRGPGLFIVWPWERAQKVDIRTVTLAIQPQDCITSDNVTVRIDAVAYFRVVDPLCEVSLDRWNWTRC